MDHTCTRRLFCELTEDELLARGKELAIELTGIVKLEIERSALNAKIKPKKERVDELAVIIDQKKEERDVKCQWFHDWNGGKKTLRRLDTFEDLETDIIREWERQQHLKFTGEVAPAGYDVDDSELTETDEKARVVSEAAEAPIAGCPKCEGDGEYYDDGIDGGGGQVYCDCPAGMALREKEHPATVESKSICATCLGDCIPEKQDPDLLADLEYCAGYRDAPSQKQESSRDDTCNDWRECSHAFKCFGPANDESGLCFKQMEEARKAEGEEESEAATEPDPLANEHGVYVDAEEITVPLPAKARATASINVIQCSDGFWRSGHNHDMRDCGGGGGMPSVKSMGHCTKYDAMLDALDGLVSKFEDYTGLTNSTAASRAKIAIEAIDEFRAGLVKGDSAA